MPVGDGETRREAWLQSQGDDAFLLSSALTADGGLVNSPAKLGEAVLGVAVSGGSDSIAMLHLLARAAPIAAWSLRAVTVDHRLRPEAAGEAAFVGRICEGLGVSHDVLIWDHGAITGNLMEQARDARYRLIAGWAQAHSIGTVTLAHTADDQAETFLVGLSRAAGLDGLTGMRQQWQQDGVTFRRPFLLQTRSDLRGFLTRHGLTWIDDPTNDNDHYTRTKARRALKALKPLGVTVDRLSSVIHNLAKVQVLVRDAVSSAGQTVVTEAAGSLQFQHAAFFTTAPEIQRRLMIAMVRWIAGRGHPPREAQVNALDHALRQLKDATLGGVRFRWTGDICTASREARAVDGPVAVGELWDGRWLVSGTGAEVRALGPAGLRLCPDWRTTGLTRQVLEVTPAVWQGDQLLSAPLANFGTAKATLAVSFNAFLLSH